MLFVFVLPPQQHQHPPRGHPDQQVSPAVAQAHDGVAVVVPVDDEFAAAQDADEPGYSDAWQAWRILGNKEQR